MSRWVALHLVAAVSVVSVVVVIVKNAWICDDAYITFRTVDNFLHGLGLRWNPAERVQTYTHPLWMFLMSAAVKLTGEYYYTAIAASIGLSFVAIALLFFGRKIGVLASLAIATALLSSQSFIDYSTSGLENAASHLIMAIFLNAYLAVEEKPLSSPLSLTLIAATASVNRPDHLLLYLPMLCSRYFRLTLGQKIRAAGFGFLPLVLWELFSLFYYGFGMPNTAYAKLNTHIAWSDLVRQGGWYFQYTAIKDPVTFVLIFLGLTVSIIRPNRQKLGAVAGIAVYLLYILRIGGDFMGGRFISTPAFCAAFLVAAGFSELETQGYKAPLRMATAMVLLSAMVSTRHPLVTKFNYSNRAVIHGVADERGYYFAFSGFVNVFGLKEPFDGDPFFKKGLDAKKRAIEKRVMGKSHVVLSPNIGIFGFKAGTLVHVIDSYALADPLLARIPSEPNPSWRIGHLRRKEPDGYRDTLKSGRNVIKDIHVARYYDKLFRIVRGELTDKERLLDILRMNLGLYDSLIDIPPVSSDTAMDTRVGDAV